MKSTDKFIFWDIILAEYVFSDNSGSKLRPVLVLFCDWEDYTVLKITSQERTLDNHTIVIEPDSFNGIKIKSFIKIKRINSFHESLFLNKKIWSISSELKTFLKEKLKDLMDNL